jgi:hypothetical protein
MEELEKFISATPSLKDGFCLLPEMEGHRFGDWTLVSRGCVREGNHRKARVRCSCGRFSLNFLDAMRKGASPRCEECRCERRKLKRPQWLVAGFLTAKTRCENPAHRQFRDYGARGIEFRFTSPPEAAAWMMEHCGLHRDKEIDRIDNNGHYEPGNLRWSTKSEQSRNTRRTRLPKGFVFKQEEWPYSKDIVERRVREGWSRERILEAARKAVAEKRRNWAEIEKRFESMTS